MNSNVGGIGSRYVGSDVGGVAVRRGTDGSVSEDEGGSVSGDRASNMSCQVWVDAQYGHSHEHHGGGDGTWEIENLDH